jgi:hypothetical protein
MLYARRGFCFSTFDRSAPGFLLSGVLCRRADDDLPGRNYHFQPVGHVAKIFCRVRGDGKKPTLNPIAVKGRKLL